MTKELRILQVDDEVADFIDGLARRAGKSTSEVLRSLLLVEPVTNRPEFEPFTHRLSEPILELIAALDLQIRRANPRASIVFRKEFFGYRRWDDEDMPTSKGTRGALFLSVCPRRKALHLALPLDPARWVGRPGVRDLRGVGHHGVGEVGYAVTDARTLKKALTLFHDWLDRS